MHTAILQLASAVHALNEAHAYSVILLFITLIIFKVCFSRPQLYNCSYSVTCGPKGDQCSIYRFHCSVFETEPPIRNLGLFLLLLICLLCLCNCTHFAKEIKA